MISCLSYKRSGPTTYFWYRETLNIAPSIESSSGLNWKLAVSLLVAWIIVYLCMVKGIKSSGKVRQFFYIESRRQITGNSNKLLQSRGRYRELNVTSTYLDFFFHVCHWRQISKVYSNVFLDLHFSDCIFMAYRSFFNHFVGNGSRSRCFLMNEWIFIASRQFPSFFSLLFNHRIVNWSLIFLSECCLFSVATLYYIFYMNFSLIWIKLNDGISNCFLQTSYNKVIIVAVLDEIPDTKQYVCNL